AIQSTVGGPPGEGRLVSQGYLRPRPASFLRGIVHARHRRCPPHPLHGRTAGPLPRLFPALPTLEAHAPMSQPTGGLDTPSPFAPARPTWVRWHILGVLLAFSFLSWFNRVSMSVAYDERIQQQLGISEEAIGYVYSALLFAYMLCMTPGGWFADRFGARLALTVMGLGSALFVAATGVVGLAAVSAAGTVAALLAGRAGLGVVTAPIFPGSGHAVARWFPARQRAAANGAIMGAALVGIAATYFAFGSLLDLFDWPAAFLITGAVTALLALAWVGYARDGPG